MGIARRGIALPTSVRMCTRNVQRIATAKVLVCITTITTLQQVNAMPVTLLVMQFAVVQVDIMVMIAH
jgi:hypothetical protein